MTARQEVQKTGFELNCRYSFIQMGLAAVAKKITLLQKVITRRCVCGSVAAVAGRKKSGTQSVFEIIQNSKRGVHPLYLKQKTEFDEQKIAKILYKLFKHGEVRIESGGRYLAVSGR